MTRHLCFLNACPRLLACLGLLACQWLTVAPLLSADSAPADASGRWKGVIEVPTGQLKVRVGLARVDSAGADSTWKGTIDIPQQGAKGLPLEGVEVDGDAVKFSIPGIPGTPTFDGRLVAGTMEGSFIQGPARFMFKLTREMRPQTPKPPFPYAMEEARYRGGPGVSGPVDLVGTLTIPQGKGPHPAVVLITGSGPQDRDGTLFDHKPFWVIADHLTRAGVAVLRVDDRGVGYSTGNLGESTVDEFAADALAGVRYLETHPAIDGERVGLLGHSEGGMVGPLAASQSSDVAFVVSLAGPGVAGDEILVRQLELILRAGGADESTVRDQLAIQAELLAAVKGGTEDGVRAKLTDVARRQSGGSLSQENIGKAVDQQMGPLTSRWFQRFVAYDPRPALAKVRVPVLALSGSLDLQVDPEQNLPEIARALEKGGNEDVTTQVFEGLNHLFQHATTGLSDEYGEIEETLSPEVLEVITGWIVERFGPSRE